MLLIETWICAVVQSSGLPESWKNVAGRLVPVMAVLGGYAPVERGMVTSRLLLTGATRGEVSAGARIVNRVEETDRVTGTVVEAPRLHPRRSAWR
jgi:hypothetical protein